MFDAGAIVLAIMCIVVLVLVGSRFFPEDMNLSPWHYHGRPDGSSPGVREDDDVRFDWSHDKPDADPSRPGPAHDRRGFDGPPDRT
jgi:hypothetical protein